MFNQSAMNQRALNQSAFNQRRQSKSSIKVVNEISPFWWYLVLEISSRGVDVSLLWVLPWVTTDQWYWLAERQCGGVPGCPGFTVFSFRSQRLSWPPNAFVFVTAWSSTRETKRRESFQQCCWLACSCCVRKKAYTTADEFSTCMQKVNIILYLSFCFFVFLPTKWDWQFVIIIHFLLYCISLVAVTAELLWLYIRLRQILCVNGKFVKMAWSAWRGAKAYFCFCTRWQFWQILSTPHHSCFNHNISGHLLPA